MGSFDDLFEDEPKKEAASKGDGGFDLFRALSNIPGDLVEIGRGIGTLAGTALKDARSLAIEAGTLGIVDRDYMLDDVAKALPGALVNDYSSRYGSRKGFVEGLEEDPLAFIETSSPSRPSGARAQLREPS